MNNLIHNSKELKSSKGFSLIELIIVIAVIGILTAIVIPNLIGFKTAAEKKADLATSLTLATIAATIYENNPNALDAEYAEGGAIDDSLPTDFDWKTQLTSGTFTVTVDTTGIIVTDGTDQIYPKGTGKYL